MASSGGMLLRSAENRNPVIPDNRKKESILDPVFKANLGDYDTIMASYRNILNQGAGQADPSVINNFRYTPITPQLQQYNADPTVSEAMGSARSIMNTGGIDNLDAIRSRAVSPIRSIYSSANRELERGKSLSGGYSPNINAARAKMAREQSALASDAVTNVEAQLADKIASGKLAGTQAFSSLAQNQNQIANAIAASNAAVMNQIAQLNSSNEMEANKLNAASQSDVLNRKDNLMNQAIATKLAATEGMKSLYGTTPAITSLVANKSMEDARLKQNQAQFNTQVAENRNSRNRQTANSILGGFRMPVWS